MIKYQVDVTKDDIKKAVIAYTNNESTARTCPISQAIKRITGFEYVSIGYSYIICRHNGKEIQMLDMSVLVERFVRNFDRYVESLDDNPDILDLEQMAALENFSFTAVFWERP